LPRAPCFLSSFLLLSSSTPTPHPALLHAPPPLSLQPFPSWYRSLHVPHVSHLPLPLSSLKILLPALASPPTPCPELPIQDPLNPAPLSLSNPPATWRSDSVDSHGKQSQRGGAARESCAIKDYVEREQSSKRLPGPQRWRAAAAATGAAAAAVAAAEPTEPLTPATGAVAAELSIRRTNEPLSLPQHHHHHRAQRRASGETHGGGRGTRRGCKALKQTKDGPIALGQGRQAYWGERWVGVGSHHMLPFKAPARQHLKRYLRSKRRGPERHRTRGGVVRNGIASKRRRS
jgi:hypothetical protein